MTNSVLRQIIFFGFAGVVGFAVDTLVLYLLKSAFGLYWARFFSFVAAVWVTWMINRHITFTEKRYTHWYQELAYYFLCMTVGGVVNLATYMLLVSQNTIIVQYPIIGVAVGSLAGMIVNFLNSKFFIFKQKKIIYFQATLGLRPKAA